MAAGDGPRGHRDAARRRARAGGRGGVAPGPGARGLRRARLGVEAELRGVHHGPAEGAGRVVRLVARALHPRRRALGGGPRGCALRSRTSRSSTPRRRGSFTTSGTRSRERTDPFRRRGSRTATSCPWRRLDRRRSPGTRPWPCTRKTRGSRASWGGGLSCRSRAPASAAETKRTLLRALPLLPPPPLLLLLCERSPSLETRPSTGSSAQEP